MKFTFRAPALAIFILMLCACYMQAQSLAEAARRSQQHTKPAAKVYTNDNLPKDGVISVIGTETPALPPESGDSKEQPAEMVSDGNPADANATSTGEKADNDSEAKNAAAADPTQGNAELQKSAAKLKEDIALLEREIDVSNREFRLRAATYYADAGNSLRNPKQWAEQQRDHETTVKEKQATLDAAKQKLADLQEQGRRMGITIE